MTMSPRARSAIAVIALLVAGLLAGCEDQEDPPEPTESSSESAPPSTRTTSEPTSTEQVEPAIPPATVRENEAGAKAFVRYYYQVINYATATGDVSDLETLHEPSCSGCQGGIDQIERVYGRGGRIIGEGYRVLRLESVRLRAGFWSVTARTHIGDQFVRGAGDLNQTFPGGRGGLHFSLRFHNGAWRTTSLEGL